MNRISDYSQLRDRIVSWLRTYRRDSGMDSWVVGVSGGIDSAVVSTLAACTGEPVFAVGMPIHQDEGQKELGSIVNNLSRPHFQKLLDAVTDW